MPAPVETQEAAICFLIYKKHIVRAGRCRDEERPRTARVVGELRKRFFRQRRGRIGALALFCKNFAQATVHAVAAGRRREVRHLRDRCAGGQQQAQQ